MDGTGTWTTTGNWDGDYTGNSASATLNKSSFTLSSTADDGSYTNSNGDSVASTGDTFSYAYATHYVVGMDGSWKPVSGSGSGSGAGTSSSTIASGSGSGAPIAGGTTSSKST